VAVNSSIKEGSLVFLLSIVVIRESIMKCPVLKICEITSFLRKGSMFLKPDST
jgi:hypothetical protein